MGKNIFEKTCLVFGLRPSVSICSASAKNVHFGASLIIIAVIYERKAEHFIVFFYSQKAHKQCKQECKLSRLAVNRGSRLDFTPRPTLFFLPAGFCCLVSSIEETPSARLSKLENYGFDQLVSQRD